MIKIPSSLYNKIEINSSTEFSTQISGTDSNGNKFNQIKFNAKVAKGFTKPILSTRDHSDSTTKNQNGWYIPVTQEEVDFMLNQPILDDKEYIVTGSSPYVSFNYNEIVKIIIPKYWKIKTKSDGDLIFNLEEMFKEYPYSEGKLKYRQERKHCTDEDGKKQYYWDPTDQLINFNYDTDYRVAPDRKSLQKDLGYQEGKITAWKISVNDKVGWIPDKQYQSTVAFFKQILKHNLQNKIQWLDSISE